MLETHTALEPYDCARVTDAKLSTLIAVRVTMVPIPFLSSNRDYAGYNWSLVSRPYVEELPSDEISMDYHVV